MKTGVWSADETEQLRKLCAEGVTTKRACNILDRSPVSIKQKAMQLGLHIQREGEWSDGDILWLRQLAEKGQTKEQIAKKMGRTEHSIQCKAHRLGIILMANAGPTGMQNRLWSAEDRMMLAELWHDNTVGMTAISKRLKRGKKAIQSQASAMKLGPRGLGVAYLTPVDIAEEMGVNKGTVYYWMQRGLKYMKRRMGVYVNMIKEKDLLDFLENNQTDFDASKVSRYLFTSEPKWFKEKREHDRLYRPSRQREFWTDDEDRKLCEMNAAGLTVVMMAQKLGRSVDSVLNRRFVLFLESPRKWSKEEIALFQSTDNIDELCILLPGRTRAAIESRKSWERSKAAKSVQEKECS